MSWLTPSDWQALILTFKVAMLTTAILLVVGPPLAWWLATSRAWWRPPVHAVLTLPVVLPPTVLGFYLLVLLSPQSGLGQWARAWGLGPFSFGGLVLASVVYSLPFMVQPVQVAMERLGPRPLEVAATLRASPLDSFFTVVLPQCKTGLWTGTVMSFAHTLGEFGVVLMVGGNIPGQTRLVSVQLYDHVEALQYAEAHRLAAVMVGLSFGLLCLMYGLQARQPQAGSPRP